MLFFRTALVDLIVATAPDLVPRPDSRMTTARVIMAEQARPFSMFDQPSFLFSALDQFLGGK